MMGWIAGGANGGTWTNVMLNRIGFNSLGLS